MTLYRIKVRAGGSGPNYTFHTKNEGTVRRWRHNARNAPGVVTITEVDE